MAVFPPSKFDKGLMVLFVPCEALSQISIGLVSAQVVTTVGADAVAPVAAVAVGPGPDISRRVALLRVTTLTDSALDAAKH